MPSSASVRQSTPPTLPPPPPPLHPPLPLGGHVGPILQPATSTIAAASAILITGATVYGLEQIGSLARIGDGKVTQLRASAALAAPAMAVVAYAAVQLIHGRAVRRLANHPAGAIATAHAKARSWVRLLLL